MAIINKDEARIAIREDGRIVFEVPLDGRRRKIVFEPDAALQFGTVLANAGFDAMPKDPGLPTVTDLHLKPFDDSGMAALRLTLKDFGGPAAFLIDAHHLLALSEAARGALELAQPGGRA
ncbi:hypothetical protein [Croceicoccus naphthovorans]|uniref:Uncharacterized protein n=1 Tax=Croceicoccus naphthovorans TaxID=1348774 RepID=A0A0G3XE81_9SPHN|nr:hypothetical protein [Croceicoccus naphthovorans]AKM09855.1 hypothetical protein AB433_07450 [Croceicoccus naphthovorans]MBB3991307.1 L-alanine-DL-glutamate epimerase-like enolase superfamily enzyme [Croceicoccus naphthovorans]